MRELIKLKVSKHKTQINLISTRSEINPVWRGNKTRLTQHHESCLEHGDGAGSLPCDDSGVRGHGREGCLHLGVCRQHLLEAVLVVERLEEGEKLHVGEGELAAHQEAIARGGSLHVSTRIAMARQDQMK